MPPTACYSSSAWELEANKIQQAFSRLLGNRKWDFIPRGQPALLSRKVGFWLFGAPQSSPSIDNKFLGYNQIQLRQIQTVCEKLTLGIDSRSTDMHFAVATVVLGFDKKEIKQKLEKIIVDAEQTYANNLNDASGAVNLYDRVQKIRDMLKITMENPAEYMLLPVFKCKGANSVVYNVVDSWHGRVYKSWQDFIREEKPPAMCRYCVPKDGTYNSEAQGQVLVEFHCSNVDSCRSKSQSAFEEIAELATFSCLIPVAPLTVLSAGANVGSYLLEQNAFSVNGSVPEAIGRWLNIAANLVPFDVPTLKAKNKLIAGTAARGRVFSNFVQGATAGSAFFQVIGMANEVAYLFKLERVRKLETTDLNNLAMASLAFANVLVTFENPEAVIKQAKKNLLSWTRAGSMFGGPLAGFENEATDYNFKEELDFKNFLVENSHDLLLAVSLGKPLKILNHHFKDGKRLLPTNEVLASTKWMCVEEQSRFDLYYSTVRFAKDVSKRSSSPELLDRAAHHHQTALMDVCETYKINFGAMHQIAISTLCTSYSEVSGRNILDPAQILVGGRAIFANLSGHEKTRLALVVQETLDNRSDLLRMALEFAEVMNCGVFRKFIKYAEYIAEKFYETRDQILGSFRQQLLSGWSYAQVRRHIGELLGVKNKNLQEPLIQYADFMAVQHFSLKKLDFALKALRQASNLAKKVRSLSLDVPKVGDLADDLASYRYHRHKYCQFVGSFSLANLDECVNVFERATGRSVNRTNVTMIQDESCVIGTYKCKKEGVVVVIINKFYGDDGNTSGIVTCMSYKHL